MVGSEMGKTYEEMAVERDKWKRMSEDRIVSPRLRRKARGRYKDIVNEIKERFKDGRYERK